MSGTAKVKPPRNNSEWARNTEKRLNSTEHPTSQRIGRWTLSEQADTGALIASHVNGGSRILVAPPEPSDEADPDEVTDDISVLSLTKTVNQSVGTTATVITWDDVRADYGGWTSGVISGGITDITVPISGVYHITTSLHFQASAGQNIVGVRVNGATQIIANTPDQTGGASWLTCPVIGMIPLLSGDILSVAAVHTAGTTNVGGSALSTPTSPCYFTAHMVARG